MAHHSRAGMEFGSWLDAARPQRGDLDRTYRPSLVDRVLARNRDPDRPTDRAAIRLGRD